MRAREVFGAARAAAKRIEELQFLCGMEGPAPGGGKGPGPKNAVSDPTGSAAEWRIEDLADLRRELEACEAVVGEALALIDGVRKAMETPWWRVLDLYYIDRLEWGDVAEELGLSVRTCYRWRDAAFDWLDFVGEANARMGRGRAS